MRDPLIVDFSAVFRREAVVAKTDLVEITLESRGMFNDNLAFGRTPGSPYIDNLQRYTISG